MAGEVSLLCCVLELVVATKVAFWAVETELDTENLSPSLLCLPKVDLPHQIDLSYIAFFRTLLLHLCISGLCIL